MPFKWYVRRNSLENWVRVLNNRSFARCLLPVSKRVFVQNNSNGSFSCTLNSFSNERCCTKTRFVKEVTRKRPINLKFIFTCI